MARESRDRRGQDIRVQNLWPHLEQDARRHHYGQTRRRVCSRNSKKWREAPKEYAMSFPTKVDQDQKTRAAEFGDAYQRGLAAIYAAYPIIMRNQANDSMIGFICAEYLGLQTHQVAPTLDVFRSALEADPNLLGSVNGNGVATKDISKQRTELIDDICDLLRAPDPSGRGGKYSAFNIDSVRTRMASWSLDALKERKAEITREQDLVKKPISELKAIVADSRPVYGFPKLPKSLMQGMVLVQIDRAYLKSLPPYELRRFCRIYSDQAVNARLTG
jgi:hypothetical protein